VQLVTGPKVESLDPYQQIIATKLSPTFQIGIADTTVIGVNQVETAVAATVAGKGLLHPLHTVTELLGAKEKNAKFYIFVIR